MGTPGQSTRWLLISLSFVTIFTVVFVQAASDPALVIAARDGDFEAVRTLVAKRVNVNETARDASTALLWAVHHSNLRMVRELIGAGANFTMANRYGVTPMLEASRTGDTPIIAELLKAGADVRRAVHPDGETPLMAAARTGRVDAVE